MPYTTATLDLTVRKGRPLRLALCVLAAGLALALGGAMLFQQVFFTGLPAVPDRNGLWGAGRPPGVTFLDKDGRVIAHRGPRHGAPVSLKDLPPHVPRAFLAAEDRRFYEHGAVDLRGIARAAKVNLEAGRAVQGGSTLTQQLARTLFLAPDKTLRRKVQEAALALKLERMMSKDEILELYLNRIYFGDRAYGLSAAAKTYFGKSPRDLTLAEAAMLAALPKAPTRLALTNDHAAAWARAQLILAEMQELGWADPQAVAAAGPPPVVHTPEPGEGDLAWALDAAALQAEELVGARSPDLVVRLTVDPALQAQGARIVREAVRGEGRRRGARQAALVALAPDGAIRAMVGGVDHAQSPFNRAWQARRQPGSAFKPFVWAAALERGVHPYELRADAPVSIGGWSPQNFGGGYSGAVSVAEALRRSINTVSVRLAREAGVERVAELSQRFGLAAIPDNPGPSIALGAYEVTLLELTSAYQVFQNGGIQRPPYLIASIANARGDLLYARTPTAGAPAYNEAQAAQMVRMMQGVIGSGTGKRAAFGRIAAGKTGTSQDHRDAWFVGFSPDWAVGVWVGNDDNRPMRRVVGGELPAVVWRRFMIAAHAGLPARGFDWMPQAAPPPPDWAEEDPGPPTDGEEVIDETIEVAEYPEGEVRIWPPQRGREDEPEPYADEADEAEPPYRPPYGPMDLDRPPRWNGSSYW
ncbi:PBP1A family penicillin-binding protein [Phenylobacterium sp.]|uniref:transglycosylase domain-containing protein n=1 Tax=Phenylobacterium sp. TaxID=1871053 RepID=UPI002E344F6A|nr:PBP1A family penicillin-binding protein [Phenylobacterium sp.]HEX2560716.1 PBP1A family penicillin-binding protein [Phenylobacterium sp.]